MRLKLAPDGMPDPDAEVEAVLSPSDRHEMILGNPGETRSVIYPWDMEFHPSGKVLFLNDADGNAVLELR